MKDNIHYGIASNKPNIFLELLNNIINNCDFLTLFSSILSINNDTYFDADKLINYIKECDKKNKYQNLLQNVNIQDKYNSFKKAISILKIDKNITEIKYQHENTKYYNRIMLINKNLNLKKTFRENNKKKINEMTNFVDDYYDYLNKDIHINNETAAKVHVRRSRTENHFKH